MGRQGSLRLWAWGLAALALAAYGAAFCAMGADFLAFRDAGEAALRREDIYAPSPTNGMWVFYAPHFSLLMAPFAALPPFAAGFLWFALKVPALAWIVREAWREIRAASPPGAAPRLPLYLAIPLLLAMNPIIGEMKLGQVNLFVLLLSLVAVRLANADRPWRAALLFSVALVKVTPWVFVPWFAFRRQWKLIGALAVTGAGWLAALAAWFGPGRVPEIFRAWLETSLAHKVNLAEVAYFENQSLQGVAARLATVFAPLAEPFHGVPAYRILWVPLAAALFAVALAVAWRDRFRPVLPFGEFAFMCTVMYLCSPDSRWAHQMQLLAPFTLLAAAAARLDLFAPASACAHGEARGWRRAVGGVLSLGVLFQVVLTVDVVGKRMDNAARWWSTHFLFVVALAALLGAMMLRSFSPAADALPGDSRRVA
jgi:hypothetical protein